MENLSLEGLLRQYITNSQNQVFTSMPGKIERVVDLGEQRVDVQLLVDRVTPDNGTLKHPVILNVPLVFPGSRTSQFSFPVSEGDTVLCVFSQRSIDRFKLGANDNHRPINLAKYSRNDCMAIPGLFSFPSAANRPDRRNLSHDTSDAVMSHNLNSSNECEIRLKADGGVIINAASGSDITLNIGGTEVLKINESVADFGVPITAPEVTTDSGVVLSTHTHSGVTSGGSNTGTPN